MLYEIALVEVSVDFVGGASAHAFNTASFCSKKQQPWTFILTWSRNTVIGVYKWEIPSSKIINEINSQLKAFPSLFFKEYYFQCKDL